MKMTETEINELAVRCEGHTADGAVTEANLHLEIAAPSLLDTCQALLRERKLLREAVEKLIASGKRGAWAQMITGGSVSGFVSVQLVLLKELDAALAQVQDGGGK